MTRWLALPVLLLLTHCSGDDSGGSGQAGSAGQTGGPGGAGVSGSPGQSAGGQSAGGQAGSGAAGSAGAGASGASGSTGQVCSVDGQTRTGEGTYYDATGAGNCSFPATPGDLMVGAMNQSDYGSSAACGSCAQIDGPDGSVTVRIVDRCPECKPGDIDLSPQAFEKLAAIEKGRIPISWRYVACPVAGSLVYHFKDGSNQWWTAVQVRNHRYPIASFEVKGADGQYRKIERLEYNYFVDPSGMGPGPYTFRVTDVLGHVVEDSGIPGGDDTDAAGAGQFPECSGG